MSDSAPAQGRHIEAVLDDDGRLTPPVPPERLAELGLRPGTHLVLVPRPRRSLDELLALGEHRRRETGLAELTEAEAAELADQVQHEVRRHTQSPAQ